MNCNTMTYDHTLYAHTTNNVTSIMYYASYRMI